MPSRSRQLASADGSVVASEEDQVWHWYMCPVFATTNRLSLGGVAAENKPVFYVQLRSLRKPYKWVKRGVALLMEPAVICKL